MDSVGREQEPGRGSGRSFERLFGQGIESVVSRRDFLRVGGLGVVSLSAAEQAALARRGGAEGRSVILLLMSGGASQLETFDPKPEAPSEFCGPYDAIDTNVPGIRISELLPGLSKIADKYTLLRSVAHNAGGHPAGSLRVLGGDPASADKPKPFYPDWMTVSHYLRSDPSRSLPRERRSGTRQRHRPRSPTS